MLKFLELFYLTLNNANIGTPSFGTANVKTTRINSFKVLFSGTLLFVYSFFIFIFFIIYNINGSYFVYFFIRFGCNKFDCKISNYNKAYGKKLVCKK